jgi:N-methylhydantoinase A
MSYYIGVDIGGTFTDCVLVDENGNHRTAKALSTKADPSQGVLAGLGLLAEAEGLSTEELLARTVRFGHGTTIGTNAVLERAGARVGLVTTAGHGDALALMRGSGRVAGRSIEEIFSVHGTRLPEPITVRGAVLEVNERVDSTGKVVVALDVDRAVADVLALVEAHDLDSVAIAFLWSFAHPAHERQLADALVDAAPELFVSISSEVSPRLGEFERIVATVMNGYVGPACSRYLGDLAVRLGQRSLAEPLLVMQSNGGVLPAEAAASTSLGTIDSGPAGGLTGVATLARHFGHDHVIATDMGGTSFDIGLVIDGKPVLAEENVIDQYTYRLPHLDVRTIACGGGTLARFDGTTGALRVGPQSAGSEPGPVSYGRGGTIPTVTDADVVLGFLRPSAFLDGRMPLDREAAVAATAALAGQLGLSVEETAAGILEINNLRAATVIRRQTLERGHDPRDFLLYAYGGAGPVHAHGFAKESGVKEVVIPLGNGASTLSAYGIASGDVLVYQEVERPLAAPFDGAQAERLTTVLAEVEDSARAALAKLDVGGQARIEIDALMRYQEQLLHSLEVAVSLPTGADAGEQILASFNAEYTRRYGQAGTALFQQAQIFAFRARVSVPAGIPVPASHPDTEVEVTTTDVYWPGQGWTPTAVHTGIPAKPVHGPALVELAHTTIAVPPGAELSHAVSGELRLRLSASEES